MKFLYQLLIVVLIVSSVSCKSQVELVQAEHTTTMKFKGDTLWVLNHDPKRGKPFFHPLGATDGTKFTDLPTTDHPWHRGLWFSWKKINKLNYWEEKGYSGIPKEGYTRLLSNDRKVSKNQSIEFTQHLEYAPSETADAIMKETRVVKVSAPDTSGNYTIDWSGEFTPIHGDIVLDRTPLKGQPNGKRFGGYAGISVRMNKNMRNGYFLSSEGGEAIISDIPVKKGNALHAQPASWMLYQKNEGGGLLFMDAPTNFSYPSKWYVNTDMPYYSPSVIYDEPKTLKQGESLKLTYRILVSPKKVNKEDATKAWENWTN